jgi:anti-anti-sigma factor
MTTLRPHPRARRWLTSAATSTAVTVVHLRGELDLATGDTVRGRLLRALGRNTSLLIVDLSEVSFRDAAGPASWSASKTQARSLDIAVGLVRAPPHMSRVLRLTGLDHRFAIYLRRLRQMLALLQSLSLA